MAATAGGDLLAGVLGCGADVLERMPGGHWLTCLTLSRGWLPGAAALAGQSAGALETVRRLLVAGAVGDVVLIPWQGWALRRDDFLLTRMLEIVVHADDLALSAGVRTPEFPAEVFAPVRDLLMRLAVKRHGQSAVIRHS